jgi:lysocardiolipin and lysophospholipid acyltransferase
MIRQLTSMVLLIIWYIYTSYGYLSPLILINKHDEIINFVQEVWQILTAYTIKYGFQSDIFYTNKIRIKKNNKINIFVCNHVASIDMFIVLGFLKYCDIGKWIAFTKKDLIYFPGFGLSCKFGKHIKLVRNWDEDKDNLIKQFEKIDEGNIIIFPEGTRFEPKKFQEGQNFSKENGLPIYDNLLVPRTKGLFMLYKYLKENNKLGDIFDISIIIQNFLGKKAHMSELLSKSMGNTFLITRKLSIPELSDMFDFKIWFLKEWKEKDKLINMYQTIAYEKIKSINEFSTLFLNLGFFGLVTYGLFTQKYFRYYFMGSIGLGYLLTLIKN